MKVRFYDETNGVVIIQTIKNTCELSSTCIFY